MSFRIGRRALIAALGLVASRPALGWDFGTVRSTFTTVIRKEREGPLLSDWRNSEYRNFTILGMNVSGGADDFRVEFTLVHDRKIGCELVIEKSLSDASSFGLWLGASDALFDTKAVISGTVASAGLQRVVLERVVAPGSYRVEALWRGRRGTEIVAPGGSVLLTITIHGTV
jgi:hypothetical protein